MFEITSLCGQICLGKQGENLARMVYFDEPSTWKETFGEGRCELLHQRNGDEAPYPVVLNFENGRTCWKITASDTAIVGDGKCELHYSVDGIIVKSKIWTTTVLPSLGGEVAEAPGPQQNWVDEVLSSAEKVESATTHQPMVGENGNWFVWNAESMDYIDSEISAKGVPGEAATITDVTAEIDNTSGVPKVNVSMSGDEQNRSLHFAFSGLKGEPGKDGSGEDGAVVVGANNYEHIYTCTVTDAEVTIFTFDKDINGNPFKLDAIAVRIECSEVPNTSKYWRVGVTSSSDTLLYYFSPDTSGKTIILKSERMCKNFWFGVRNRNTQSTILNSPMYSSYCNSDVDYIENIYMSFPEIPTGAVITVCGRRVLNEDMG